MRVPFSVAMLVGATVLCLGPGCASAPNADTVARPAVPVYELNPYIGKQYDVAERIWTGTWRAAFWVPTYTTRDEAIGAMQVEAARVNADALITVTCLDQRGSTWIQGDKPAYLCYGLAIKLQQS